MSNHPEFADLQIRILEPVARPLPGNAQGPSAATTDEAVYPVEISLNRALEFERGYMPVAAVTGWQSNAADRVGSGKALFQLLLGHATIRDAWAQVKGMYPRRRVRLRVDFAAPELNAIPWELMVEHAVAHGQEERASEAARTKQLAAAADTPFLRYQADQHPLAPPLMDRPIRILVAIANPDNLADYGLAQVDPEQELDILQQATEGLDICLHKVENCTIQALEAELRQGYHILHFVGHGAYNEDRKESVIYMADADKKVHLVSAHFEASLIARQYAIDENSANTLRLVCMVSCQSATRDPGDAFRGFAPKLVAAGVPAVIAMQDRISLDSARIFTATFYRRLLEHGLVDLACNEARSALLTAQAADAHVPVLYTRLHDGQLLAPDPIYTTLRSMLNDELYQTFESANREYLDLPIEVTHMPLCDADLTPQSWKNIRAFAGMQSEMTAGISLKKAIAGICASEIHHPEHHEHKSKVILLVGDYGSSKATQLKYLAWQAMTDALRTASAQGVAPDQAMAAGAVVGRRGLPSDQVLIPIYVDLRSYSDEITHLHSPAELDLLIERLLLRALQPHWPGMGLRELRRQLHRRRFRFLFAKGEYLSAQLRNDALQQINAFIHRLENDHGHLANEGQAQGADSGPPPPLQHEIMLTLSPSHFERNEVRHFTREQHVEVHLLVIQCLRVGKIRHFLQQRSPLPNYANRLLTRLDTSGLYDLAAIPWFFVDMVERAKAGQLPESRVELLRNQVQDAITRTSRSLGIQIYIFDALCAIAWKMTAESREILSLPEVFDILSEVRRNRDFLLEEFYLRLVETQLLTHVGSGEVQFTYSRIRAYCCAYALFYRPDRVRRLDLIVATLGRLSYLNWWGDVLIYFCGLSLTDPTTLNQLLESIVYGINLLESEQIFLAAHCLLETMSAANSTVAHQISEWQPDPALVGHVTGALLWRLNKENEPNSTYRDRAAVLLGYLVPLPDAEMLRQLTQKPGERTPQIDAVLLAETAYKPQPGNDIGNMNWAAVLAFLRVKDPDLQAQFLMMIDPALAAMMHEWRTGNAAALIQRLQTYTPEKNIQGIAALALADLLGAQPEATVTDPSLQALVEAFFTIKEAMPLWSIVHALATLDSPLVIAAVVLPYRDEVERRKLSLAGQWEHRKYFTYLIGLLRVHNPRIRELLLENFALCHRRRVQEIQELVAETINAIGRLADPKDKSLLETLAVGHFADLLPVLTDELAGSSNVTTRVRTSVQRAAVDALAYIGDEESVDVLRRLREEITRSTLTTKNGHATTTQFVSAEVVTVYYRELNLAIDRTTDTIYWRTHWRQPA